MPFVAPPPLPEFLEAELPFELEPEQVSPDPATDAVFEPLIQPVQIGGGTQADPFVVPAQ